MFSTWIMVHLTANLSGSWVGQDMRNSMGRLLDSFDLSVPSTSRSSIAYPCEHKPNRDDDGSRKAILNPIVFSKLNCFVKRLGLIFYKL